MTYPQCEARSIPVIHRNGIDSVAIENVPASVLDAWERDCGYRADEPQHRGSGFVYAIDVENYLNGSWPALLESLRV